MLRMKMVESFKKRSVEFLESKIRQFQGKPFIWCQTFTAIYQEALQAKHQEEATLRAVVEAKAREEAENLSKMAKIQEEMKSLSAVLAKTRSDLAEILVKEKIEMDLLEQTLKQEIIIADEIHDVTKKCTDIMQQHHLLLNKIQTIVKDVSTYKTILKDLTLLKTDSPPSVDSNIIENNIENNRNELQNELTLPGNLYRDLVAYFPFNGNTVDETGQGHDAELSGVTLTRDRFGNENNAYHFDGQGYIKGNANEFPDADRTISLWFKPDIYPRSEQIDRGGSLFGYGGDGQGGTSFLLLMNDTASDIAPNNYETQGHYSLNRLSFIDNTMYGSPSNWTHLVLTTKHDTGTSLYLNGNLVTNNTHLYINNTSVSGTDFAIGSICDPNGHAPCSAWNSGNFKGDIDEMRIYNRALNEEEVKTLYQLPKKDSKDDCEKIRMYLEKIQSEINRLNLNTSPATNLVNEAALESLKKMLAETKVLLVEARERESIENIKLQQEVKVENDLTNDLEGLYKQYDDLNEVSEKLLNKLRMMTKNASIYNDVSPTLFSAVNKSHFNSFNALPNNRLQMR